MKGISIIDGSKVVFDLTVMNEQVDKYNKERGAEIEKFDPNKGSFQDFTDFVYTYRNTVVVSQTTLKATLK